MLHIDAIIPERIVNKCVDFIKRLTQEHQSVAPPPLMDTLHQEIHQIEQTLVKASYQSSMYVVQKTRPLEPVTEQQKIIDLAG